MKYSKNKTKKLQPGGKTTQQIMEEARRNQATELAAQARDAIANSGIPAYQSTPATVQMPKQNVELKEFAPTKQLTFGEAFAQASKAGLKEFDWFDPKIGKIRKIAVKLTNEPTSTNKSTNTNTSENNTSTAQQTEEVSEAATPQTSSQILTPSGNVQNLVTGTPTEIPTETYGQFPRTDPRSTASASASATQSSSNWWERFNENNAKRREEARNRSSRGVPEVLQRIDHVTNKLSMRYQQGGQLPSYQQGGVLNNLKNWASQLFVDPNRHQVNPTTSTTYRQRTPFIGASTESRFITGGDGQTSKMIIKNPYMQNADTTFYSPGYQANPDLYHPFKPSDIRLQNTLGKGKESYLQKFINPEYFPHIKQHQQGGQVNQDNEQLMLEFIMDYFAKTGKTQDELIDENGGLKDEYANEATQILQEVNTPEFWEEYKKNPDQMVTNYIERNQSPQEVEMAKKGTKLKNLKDKKARKCKCGCNLTLKKGDGGTIVEVCACGCKNK